ncbi:MAG: hypothetical protein AAGF10_05790 [Verrucomicrobiota bacterium]
MQSAPVQPISHVELTLEKGRRVDSYRGLLFLFWGLILAKCCLMQWAIITYAMPINGFAFIWVPTLIFGLVCTVIYARVTLKEFHDAPLTNRLVRGIWVACAIALVLLSTLGIGMQAFSPTLLPGLLAVIMGLGYCIHGYLDGRRLYFFAAAGWWLGSIVLFSQNNVASLAWLALFLICFQVLPTAWIYGQQRSSSASLMPTAGAR